MPKRYIPRQMHVVLAFIMVPWGIEKLKPVKNMKADIRGNVVKSKLRRPKVSIVYMAGIAKSQLIIPNPRLADKAEIGKKPPSRKIWEL